MAFRPPRNLRDLLVCADLYLPKKAVDSFGNFHCDARRCKTCPILVTTNTLSSSATGDHFKFKLRASCKTFNIICLIQCRRCGLQYVGETGQLLHNWMNGHSFNITHGCINESPVAAYFTSKGHTEIDMSVMITDRCWREEAIIRNIRESRWIRMLDTAWPSGMNYRTDGL